MPRRRTAINKLQARARAQAAREFELTAKAAISGSARNKDVEELVSGFDRRLTSLELQTAMLDRQIKETTSIIQDILYKAKASLAKAVASQPEHNAQ